MENLTLKATVERETTIIIKTFERPDCIKKCVESIRKFYPKIIIYVCDDSRIPLNGLAGVDLYLSLPFDSGLSMGRNVLLSQVKTKFFMLADDDFIFTDNTKLEYALKVLLETRFDLVAGICKPNKWEPFYGSYRKTSTELLASRESCNGEMDGANVGQRSRVVYWSRLHD